MKYIYQSQSGKFWQGLPAADIDSEQLDPEQLTLLRLGVDAGVYQAESADADPLLPPPPAEDTAAEPAADDSTPRARTARRR